MTGLAGGSWPGLTRGALGVRVAVVGATGSIGRPLVAQLSVNHDVVGIARTPTREPRDRVEWIAADARVRRGDACCTGQGRSRLPPRPLAQKRGLRGARPRRRRRRFERRGGRTGAADRLSRWTRRRRGRTLAASPQPSRNSQDPRRRASPGDDASSGGGRWSEQRRVRDDPGTCRETAGHGVPALDLGRDSARGASGRGGRAYRGVRERGNVRRVVRSGRPRGDVLIAR